MRTILLLIVALAASLGGSAWGNDNEILLRTPDLMQLSEGIQAWEKGDRKDARRHFERAAEYGNNDARFSLGVMYFQGEGVERDLPRAHAWLSLAATVGSDQRVAARDQVWELMDDSQRKRARKVSQELRDKYGNLAAMRKRDEWGRKNKREFTGSRVGASASALRIDVPTVGGSTKRVSGHVYFQALEQYVNEVREFDYDIEYGDLEVAEDSAG